MAPPQYYICICKVMSGPGLGPTQPHIHCVLWALSLGGKQPQHNYMVW